MVIYRVIVQDQRAMQQLNLQFYFHLPLESKNSWFLIPKLFNRFGLCSSTPKNYIFLLKVLDWNKQTCRIVLVWISLEIGQKEKNTLFLQIIDLLKM